MDFSAFFGSLTLAGQAKNLLLQHWQRFFLGMLLLCTHSVMSSIASTSSNLGGQAGTFVHQLLFLFLLSAAIALLYNWPTTLILAHDSGQLEARFAEMQKETKRKIKENHEKMTAKLQSEVKSLRAETRQLKIDLQTKLERDLSMAHEDRRQWHEWASLRELHDVLKNKNDQLKKEIDTTAAATEQLKYPIKNLEHRAETTETELEDLKRKVARLEAKKECRCVPAIATAPPAAQSTPVKSRISESPSLGATASNADAPSSGNDPAVLTSTPSSTTLPNEASISASPSLGSLARVVTPATTNLAPAPDTDRLAPSTPSIPDSSSLGYAASTSSSIFFESVPALLTPPPNASDVSAALDIPRSDALRSSVDDGTIVAPEEPTAPLTGPATDSALDDSVNIPSVGSTGVVVDEPVQNRPGHLVEDAVVVPQQQQSENKSDISIEPTRDITKSQQASENKTPPEDHTSGHAPVASCAPPQSPTQKAPGDLNISEAIIPARPAVESAATTNEQRSQPPISSPDPTGWNAYISRLAPQFSTPPAARPSNRSPSSTVQSQPAQATGYGTNQNRFKQRRVDGATASQTPITEVGTSQGQTQSQDTRVQTKQSATSQPAAPQTATPQPENTAPTDPMACARAIIPADTHSDSSTV